MGGGGERRDNEAVEPLPAGARVPPSPPRPPAPPTTGWMGGPGEPPPRSPHLAPRPTVVEFLRQCLRELGKVSWPPGRTLRTNATVIVLTVIGVILALGTLELAFGGIAGRLFS